MNYLLVVIVWIINISGVLTNEAYSFVQITDVHIGDKGLGPKAMQYYETVVNEVNKIVDEYNIKFAFLTGDLTDSALEWQWEEAKKISEMLKISYFPILGNHDIWSYNDTWEEDTPSGDYQFLQYFGDKLTKDPSVGLLYNYTGTRKVYNPDRKIFSYFQNFCFEYENNVFINSDFNSRRSAVKEFGYKGSFPSAELHEFKGGSYEWLDNLLENLSKRIEKIGNIFFVQHHPFRCPLYIPCSIYSFSPEKRLKFRELLEKHKIPLDKVFGDISGHLHLWEYYDAFEVEWGNKFMEWISNAVKVDVCFTLFLIDENGKLKDIKKFSFNQL